ncbi:hypothetical protein P154DRAFT_519744 [Amniculicola lignicola CBS 123094]|uniref:Pre-mRNA-splicing factor 38B n=1 Tax=Amniculicola lignicola CBS 123094 TaxID=1392246 RepID=A0A6A5WXL0_9PLEO|nr:hypothetical protein P154DRAFT_519744 [Amniculicola lignicola CBS 123094]
MGGDELNDDYVVDLLKKDAKLASEEYKFVGLDAFLPKRATTRAPKPNTGFLRNIIKQTDSHNAALLAKEAEESRARLKKLDRAKSREDRGPGRLTPPGFSNDEAPQRKRNRGYHSDGDTETEEGHRSKSHRRGHRDHHDSRSRNDRHDDLHRDSGRRRERTKHRDREEEKDERPKRSRRDYDEERRHRNSSVGRDDRGRQEEKSNRKHRRRRSYSRSTSRSRSPRRESRPRYKPSRRRHDDRSRSASPRRHRAKSRDRSGKSQHRSPAPASDSDPLEAIVGPLLPDRGPAVRSRGRGANKASSMAMDARFSSTYDPSAEARLDSDINDDWGDALEALKDRERWKRVGAERLKEVGFTDAQVKKWEKGEEKGEDDVVWSREGQTREWDRGKVIDDDGDVKLQPEWGRLT